MAGLIGPRVHPGGRKAHQREEGDRVAVGKGGLARDQAGQRHRVVAELPDDGLVAGGQVSLVEDEVEHGVHGLACPW